MANVVKYRIFVKDGDNFATGSNLETCLANYLAFLSPIVEEFIWQNEPFFLHAKSGKGDESPAHLYGKTEFGDNVDNEWFIVSLLLQLSKVFPETCISLSDNDGEFLLIEAAHFLPRWLKPENSKNRVFIHDGRVHIIPIPSTPGELPVYPTGTPTVFQALQLVFGVHNTVAAAKIQTAINQRINSLSEQSLNTFHHAHCYIPAEIKYVLDQKPSLISPIVRAFCERDPIDMKACRKMEQFTIERRLMARIRFTRCLFAQLSQQPFKPERRCSGWTLPAISNPQYKAHELGLKLACGFQILCKRNDMKGPCAQEEPSDPKGLKWETFLTCLTKQGYFKGEIEGSKLYEDLLLKAKQQFKENFTIENRSEPEEVILRILKDAKIDVEKMKEEPLLPEDDDIWLNLSDQDLEDILSKYSDPKSTENGTEDGTINSESLLYGDERSAVDLDKVTRSLKSFVDKVSSYEGAEFPGENENDEIQFDAASFMDTVGNLLGNRTSNHEESSAESESDEEDVSLSSDDEHESDQGVQGNMQSGGEDKELTSYMDQMDEELSRTSIGESFEKRGASSFEAKSQGTSESKNSGVVNEVQGSDDEDAPVDVDFNLVKNILESFSTQEGLAGPASNILSSMGVWLPPNADLTDTS